MKYVISAAVLALFVLCLRTFSAWRRLTVLREDADQALELFHAQQHGRIDALAALIDLANEHVPGAVRVRSDARYFKSMNDMSYHESLSNTNRLLYNASVNKLNRELRRFPVSARLLGFQKQEHIEGPANLERIVV